MPILVLALKSVLSRRLTASLMVVSISLSVMLLLGVERLRTEARAGFANTISGTDLIVGARTGATALLLHSVFRIGYATNNVSWTSYQEIARHPRVRWTIPLSLGDTHRGFAVLGTNGDYFRHYHYMRDRGLEFAAGRVFDDVYDVVLGADVAGELRLRLLDPLVVAHGTVDADFTQHSDKPFRVVGVLRKTGTPVDRTVHVSLAGLEAIHLDWQSGMRVPGAAVSAEEARRRDLTPRSITAFLVGLDSRTAVFHVQRFINDYRGEPLLAILPGVVLQELWGAIGVAERALLGVSALVALDCAVWSRRCLPASTNAAARWPSCARSVPDRGTSWPSSLAKPSRSPLRGSCWAWRSCTSGCSSPDPSCKPVSGSRSGSACPARTNGCCWPGCCSPASWPACGRQSVRIATRSLMA